MISTIAFDYGGVLERAERFEHDIIIEYLQIEKEAWEKVYFSLNYLCNVGGATFEDILVLTAEKLGATSQQQVHIRELNRANNLTKKLNAELIEIIKKLKENYTIALISNYPLTLRKKLEDQGIISLFDAIIISTEVGCQKPDPAIFKIVCERLNIQMSELIFIDDREKSLEGAATIGYTNSFPKIVESLVMSS